MNIRPSVNYNDMNQDQRNLSDFLYSLYCGKNTVGEPVKGRHSRLTDQQAMALANNQQLVLKLAMLSINAADPDAPHGEISAIIIEPVVPEEVTEMKAPGDLLSDLINKPAPKPKQDLIYNVSHIDTETLWRRAADVLRDWGYDGIAYDPHHNVHADGRNATPGIYGDRDSVDIHSVNGALIQVLKDANAMDYLQDVVEHFADREADGWVFTSDPSA
jgi:hypothetical protein